MDKRSNKNINKFNRTFYRYLVNKKGRHSNLTLEGNCRESCNKFIVSYVDKEEAPIFTYFGSYIDYYTNIVKKVPIEQQHFFEVIMGNQKQKMRYDIDINATNCPEFSECFAESVKDIVIELTQSIMPVNLERDVVLCTSHGVNKFSYHIIINNWHLESNQQCKLLYDKVLTKVPNNMKPYIDSAVYGKKQQFRLLLSQKTGSGRTKIFNTSWYYKGQLIDHIYSEYIDDPTLIPLQQISESLVSFVDTSLSKIFKVISTENDNINKIPNIKLSSLDITDEEIQACFNLLGKDTKYFNINSFQDFYITLNRLSPSECAICKRKHDKENPYLCLYKHDNQISVYFDCRRRIDQKRLFLGTIPLINNDLSYSIIDIEPNDLSLLHDNTHNAISIDNDISTNKVVNISTLISGNGIVKKEFPLVFNNEEKAYTTQHQNKIPLPNLYLEDLEYANNLIKKESGKNIYDENKYDWDHKYSNKKLIDKILAYVDQEEFHPVIKYNGIKLEPLNPSYCHSCKYTHYDKDMFINIIKGAIYLYCSHKCKCIQLERFRPFTENEHEEYYQYIKDKVINETKCKPPNNVIIDEYVEDYIHDLDINKSTQIIWSKMDSRKTVKTLEFIERHRKKIKTIAVITCKRSFASAINKSFKSSGFDVSFYINEDVTDKKFVIIQTESLYKLTRCYDLVIIDEIIGAVVQMDSGLHKDNLKKNQEMMAHLITDAKWLLLLDADIDDRVLKLVDTYRSSHPIHLQKNNKKRGNINALKFPTERQITAYLKEWITKGNNIAVCVSTLKQGRILEQMFKELNINYIFHCAEDPQSAILENVNHYWKSYQVVMYTSVVCEGIDFHEDYFDVVFVYGNNKTTTQTNDGSYS